MQVQLEIIDSSGNQFGASYPSTFGTAPQVQAVGYKRFDVLGGHGKVFLGLNGCSTLSLLSVNEQTWFAMHKL